MPNSMNAKKKGVALSTLSMIMIVASIIIAAMAAGLTVQQFTSGANSTSGSTFNTTPVSTSSMSSSGVQSETSSLSQAAASSTTIASSTLPSASSSYTQTSSTTASSTQTFSQSTTTYGHTSISSSSCSVLKTIVNKGEQLATFTAGGEFLSVNWNFTSTTQAKNFTLNGSFTSTLEFNYAGSGGTYTATKETNGNYSLTLGLVIPINHQMNNDYNYFGYLKFSQPYPPSNSSASVTSNFVIMACQPAQIQNYGVSVNPVSNSTSQCGVLTTMAPKGTTMASFSNGDLVFAGLYNFTTSTVAKNFTLQGNFISSGYFYLRVGYHSRGSTNPETVVYANSTLQSNGTYTLNLNLSVPIGPASAHYDYNVYINSYPSGASVYVASVFVMITCAPAQLMLNHADYQSG